MRNLLYVLSFVFILVSSCSKCQTGVLGVQVTTTTDTATHFAGKTVVYFGDSITEGFGVTTSQRWTTLLSTAKGATEDNRGVSGSTGQDEVAALPAGCDRQHFVKENIPVYSASYGYLFIAYGVNDIGVNHATMTPAGYQSDLETAIDYAVATKGWPASRIVILTPYYFTNYSAFVYEGAGACGVTEAATTTRHLAYRTAAIAVAQGKHTILADVYTAMKTAIDGGQFLLSGDGIHPHEVGHEFLADYLAALSYAPQ